MEASICGQKRHTKHALTVQSAICVQDAFQITIHSFFVFLKSQDLLHKHPKRTRVTICGQKRHAKQPITVQIARYVQNAFRIKQHILFRFSKKSFLFYIHSFSISLKHPARMEVSNCGQKRHTKHTLTVQIAECGQGDF